MNISSPLRCGRAMAAVAAAMALVTLAPVLQTHGAETFYPNVVVCSSNVNACEHVLPVTMFQPLGGAEAFYVDNCVTPGHVCLPVGTPIGDWVTAWVSNVGLSESGPFSVGLYLSRRVDPVTRGCRLDAAFPLRDAIQLATYRIEGGLRAGEARLAQFPRAVTVEAWMASQWHTNRDALHQCLFVFGDDGGEVFELQSTEADNLAATSVRLLDLVDLQVGYQRVPASPGSGGPFQQRSCLCCLLVFQPVAFQVSFSAAPWLSARVRNNGIVTAPPFQVDFYQVGVLEGSIAKLVGEGCILADRVSKSGAVSLSAPVRLFRWTKTRPQWLAQCSPIRSSPSLSRECTPS